MTIRERAVMVKRLPQLLSGKQGRTFLCEIESCMNVHRPHMVLDCSNVHQMDRSVIHVLLCCLEEAMKRNGDVKLAALPPEARAILKQSGINRLFDIFDTTADAVDSFRRPGAAVVPQTLASPHSHREPESAT